MAHVAPLGREAAIQKVAAGELPFSIGARQPRVMVLVQEGKFRIRELIVDQEAAKNASGRRRSPSWMPEHHLVRGTPTGKIYAEAATARELVEMMRAMSWPEDW